jgi:hypothetical protein
MNNPTKLTRKTHNRLVEAIRTGCTLRCAAAGCSITYTTLKRWMIEARDPLNKKQRALRAHIKRVPAEAEQQALKNIQFAGSSEWRAAAWFLTNSIRGRYLKTARSLRPEMSISVADIARDLNDGDIPPEPTFRCCAYCGMEFEVTRRNQRFCNQQCRQLELGDIRSRGGVDLDHPDHSNGEVMSESEVLTGIVSHVPDDDGGGLTRGDRHNGDLV